MALEVNEINSESASGTTFFSGTSTLESKISEIASLYVPGGSIYLQNGTNTYTGGTGSNPSVNVSALTINSLTVSGDSSLSVVSATTFFSGSTNLENIFLTKYRLSISFHSSGAANLTLTNQNSAPFILNNNPQRNVKIVDLAQFTRCRLIARVITSSNSTNNPRLILEAATSYGSGTVNDYFTIGENGQDAIVSLSAVGMSDSGWITMASTARTDNIFLTVVQSGGNNIADPALGNIIAHFE